MQLFALPSFQTTKLHGRSWVSAPTARISINMPSTSSDAIEQTASALVAGLRWQRAIGLRIASHHHFASRYTLGMDISAVGVNLAVNKGAVMPDAAFRHYS